MVSIKEFKDDLLEIFDKDYLSDINELIHDKLYRFISISSSSDKQERINDLLTFSSSMSHYINSNDFISSESHLVYSKFQYLFHYLITDVYNQSIIQALGDRISNFTEVDDALIN